MQATAKSFGPRKKLPSRILRAVIIGVFLLWTLIPVALIVITSFKLPVDIFTRVPRLIFHPTLINYTNAFLQENWFRTNGQLTVPVIPWECRCDIPHRSNAKTSSPHTSNRRAGTGPNALHGLARSCNL